MRSLAVLRCKGTREHGGVSWFEALLRRSDLGHAMHTAVGEARILEEALLLPWLKVLQILEGRRSSIQEA